MKKQILVIFTGAMELGGIERSLLGLLDAIDYERYSVDLFLYAHHGPLFRYINPNVNLLKEVRELAYLRDSLAEKVKHKTYYAIWRRLLEQWQKKGNDESWHKVLRHCAPVLNKEYDLALGFFLPFDFLREYVNAKIKVGWIHTDYSYGKADCLDLHHSYRGLDYIAAVSEGCKAGFIQKVPEYENRAMVIENCLSAQFVRIQADLMDIKTEMSEDGSIRLLSVGRFCESKNFDNVPAICKAIREQGIDAKWYIIGYGGDEHLIREKIVEAGMQHYVIVLGKKENPYPYIKACDLYVQPSRYEGKCVSVIEAQILNKPVIITNYATSSSQLIDGYDGVIVPMDNEGCAEGIVRVIRDKQLQQRLMENTKMMDYTNNEEILKLYHLMES